MVLFSSIFLSLLYKYELFRVNVVGIYVEPGGLQKNLQSQ